MQPISQLINSVRESYDSDADLMRTAINSTSWVEASLAVTLAGDSVSQRTLVTAVNLREALKELPRCPITMALDFETLARVWDLKRVGGAWERAFDDPDGGYTIILLGEGNYCYDLVVRTDGRTLMWMPIHPEEDFLSPDVVDLLVRRTTLLPTVIELNQAMGLPFSPLFYLSLEDWHQEYAETMFAEATGLFASGEPESGPAACTRSWQRKAERLRPERRCDSDVTWLG